MDENFDDASSPTGAGGDWTYEETTIGSDGANFLRTENRPVEDCDGSECELALSVRCDGDEEITASYVGDGGEMFGDAEDAARPIGVA